MASLQNTKRRMKSVDATRKITKAMELVSSAKLRKAKNYLAINSPVASFVKKDLASIAYEVASQNNQQEYLVEDKNKPTLYIIVASDMGLCGGYNTNVVKEAVKHAKENDQFILLGAKPKAFLEMNNYHIVDVFKNISKEPRFYDMYYITKVAWDLFNKGEVGSIKIASTKFVSAISFEPVIYSLIPLVNPYPPMSIPLDNQDEAADFMHRIIRDFINSAIYTSIMEARVCEFAASRMAMENATKNADEIKEKLLLEYNRVRQAKITQEIAEIVGGADAI